MLIRVILRLNLNFLMFSVLSDLFFKSMSSTLFFCTVQLTNVFKSIFLQIDLCFQDIPHFILKIYNFCLDFYTASGAGNLSFLPPQYEV